MIHDTEMPCGSDRISKFLVSLITRTLERVQSLTTLQYTLLAVQIFVTVALIFT